jgi:hypothetical protein
MTTSPPNVRKAPKGEQLMYTGCTNKGNLKQRTKTEKKIEEREAGTQIPKSKLQKTKPATKGHKIT